MAAKRFISGSTERKLRVLVDMDQVLADFEGHFLKKFKEKYPEEPFIPLEDRRTFYLTDQYEEIKDGIKAKVKSIYETKGFFRELPEIPGACKAVKELKEMDRIDMFICTSPMFQYQYCVIEKYQWVEEHLGKDFINLMILTRDKTMVNGHLLIDDRPNIRGACYPDNVSWEHILFTANHNKHMKNIKQQRLENWTDGSWRDLIEDRLKRI